MPITGIDIADETLFDNHIAPTAAIAETKTAYDILNGHHHDGIDSRLVIGSGGGDTWVIDDAFMGAVNDVNTVFTLSGNYKPDSVMLHVQGIRQKRGPHFTETAPNQITLSTAPKTGQILTIDFVTA